MAYIGTDSKKRVDVCICVTDSLCCMAETNTILYDNYTPIKITLKRSSHSPGKNSSSQSLPVSQDYVSIQAVTYSLNQEYDFLIFCSIFRYPLQWATNAVRSA